MNTVDPLKSSDNILTALQQSYDSGWLSKDDFIAKSNLFHQSLWTYCTHLSQSEVKEIILNEHGIQFLMGEEQVRLWVPEGESRIAPLEALNFGAYEPQETRVMNVLAAGARCILDVGANIGYNAIRLAIREPQACVHAFEPLPLTMEYLQRNVALNSLGERIRVYTHGHLNANGSFEFFIAPEHGVNANLMNVADRPNARRIVSTTLTLDEWIHNHSLCPDYIEVDVEGAELLVLQGGKEAISQYQPKIFSELLRKWSAPFGYHPNDVLSFMADLGYGCWGVGAHGV